MLMPKPNFLILMADQLTPGALPAYGNAVARTPNLDSLAADGITFRSAYCNSPLCAPSRFSFMTGRLPSAIGAYDNAAELSAELPTFAHYLRLEIGRASCRERVSITRADVTRHGRAHWS